MEFVTLVGVAFLLCSLFLLLSTVYLGRIKHLTEQQVELLQEIRQELAVANAYTEP
jgi:hypothetical protein